MQEQCRRVLDGELTTTDALIQLPSERERQSLCNAVASTCIEGVEVAKQMKLIQNFLQFYCVAGTINALFVPLQQVTATAEELKQVILNPSKFAIPLIKRSREH